MRMRRASALYVFLFTILLLSRCTVSWGDEPPAAKPLSLGQAVVNAIKNHPDLRVAKATIMAAEAALTLATSAYYPIITSSNGFSESQANNAAAGGRTVIRTGSITNYSVGVSGSQTLLDFGRTSNAVAYAEQALNASEETAEGTLMDTLLNVTVNYFTVLTEAQAIAINEDNVRNARRQLGSAQGFYEIGTRAKIEVTRAESDLATAQLALIQAQGLHSRARVALGQSMGERRAAEAPLYDTVLKEPPWSIDEAVDLALRYRPDLKAETSVVAEYRYNWKAAIAQYYPSITSNASWGKSGNVFPPIPYQWSLGVNVNFPIFEEPTLSAGVAAAQALFLQAEAQLESLSLAARSAVASAWYDLNEAKASFASAQAGLASSEESYRLASERYQVGVGSSLDVSVAQAALVLARSTEVQDRYNIQLAIARIYRQTGVLSLELLLGATPVPTMLDSAPMHTGPSTAPGHPLSGQDIEKKEGRLPGSSSSTSKPARYNENGP
jgi:outer membrane protein